VAVSPDGTTTVVWSRDDGNVDIVQARTRPAGSNSFGAVEPLSAAASGAFAQGQQVAVGADGATTVVWSQYDGSDYIVQARTRPAGSGTFGAVQDLSTPAINPSLPQVAVGADGMTTVAWSRDGGSGEVVEYVSSAATYYALTVTKQGSGTVTSSPAGIDCGTTCTSSVRWGSTVTLTAGAAAGSTFSGWRGACSGTATTCTVRMDQARAVTAEFSAQSSSGSSSTRKSSLRVLTARGQGQEVVLRVRVSGPGRVSAVGTVAGARARASRAVVCTVSKRVRAAGVARLLCRLNATGRGLLARQALSVRVAVTYRPASGTTRRAVRTVRLAQLTPSPTPVTG
jgi:hypothetical protein